LLENDNQMMRLLRLQLAAEWAGDLEEALNYYEEGMKLDHPLTQYLQSILRERVERLKQMIDKTSHGERNKGGSTIQYRLHALHEMDGNETLYQIKGYHPHLPSPNFNKDLNVIKEPAALLVFIQTPDGIMEYQVGERVENYEFVRFERMDRYLYIEMDASGMVTGGVTMHRDDEKETISEIDKLLERINELIFE
jgi:hypothetical protein